MKWLCYNRFYSNTYVSRTASKWFIHVIRHRKDSRDKSCAIMKSNRMIRSTNIYNIYTFETKFSHHLHPPPHPHAFLSHNVSCRWSRKSPNMYGWKLPPISVCNECIRGLSTRHSEILPHPMGFNVMVIAMEAPETSTSSLTISIAIVLQPVGPCITVTIRCCHKPCRWQHSFHLKTELPFAKRLATASDRCGNTSPRSSHFVTSHRKVWNNIRMSGVLK